MKYLKIGLLSMKNIFLILLVFMLCMTSSCCFYEKDIADAAAAVASVAIGEAIAKATGDMIINVLSIGAYYVEYKEWPANKEELCTFCENKGFEDSFRYWSSCNDMEFSVQEDESIKISFTRNTTNSKGELIESSGSIILSKPDYDDQDIEQFNIEHIEVNI